MKVISVRRRGNQNRCYPIGDSNNDTGQTGISGDDGHVQKPPDYDKATNQSQGKGSTIASVQIRTRAAAYPILRFPTKVSKNHVLIHEHRMIHVLAELSSAVVTLQGQDAHQPCKDGETKDTGNMASEVMTIKDQERVFDQKSAAKKIKIDDKNMKHSSQKAKYDSGKRAKNNERNLSI